MANSLGYEDEEGAPAEEMFAAVRRIASAVDVPVTADVERGYGLGPGQIVDRLVGSGAVGCNVEDSDPVSKEMIPAHRQAELLADLRAAATDVGVPIVLNARIDVYLRAGRDAERNLDEAITRARLYLEAGADCVFPMFVSDRSELKQFVERVDGPVNAGFSGSVSLGELASIGVARVSFGPGLHRLTQSWLTAMGEKIRAGGNPYSP